MTTTEQAQLEQAMLQQFSQAVMNIPFNHMLGLQLDHVGKDTITMSFAMKNELIGNFLHGILHGGVISSVLDMVGGMAVMVTAINKHPHSTVAEITQIVGKCSTVDLQISYLRPGKGERFIAKATLIKSGNKISFTRMDLYNQDETHIATGTGTYLLK